MIIYDDLALEAWTQKERERGSERESERGKGSFFLSENSLFLVFLKQENPNGSDI